MDSTLSCPLIPRRLEVQSISIEGSASTRLRYTWSARSSSLRWTMNTFWANRVRYRASSTAELPPPTTATVLSLKNAPSHVAQYETPRPRNFFSPTQSKPIGSTPVAIMTERAAKVLSGVWISFASPDLNAYTCICLQTLTHPVAYQVDTHTVQG